MGWGQGTPVQITPPPLPFTPCGLALAVCGACQEAAAVPVPVHAGPACLRRGECGAGGPVGQLEHRGEGAGPTWYMGFPGLAETTVVLPVGQAS